MEHPLQVYYCGEDATTRLIRYCHSRQLDRFLLVCDQNTYRALGHSLERSLTGRGWDIQTVVLRGTEVLADEKRVLEVLKQAHGQKRTYLAVGSGTVTDITRYASYCARNAFISLPTAPSVDAYASMGAALIVDGYKTTLPSHGPVAIFAHQPTLCEAPHRLIAAGFGDMVGKYVALADWQLAALLVDEPYLEDIARRARRALLDCVAHVDEIGEASATGVEALMAALIESGLCMAACGNSRPASGSEHLFSHFWEMRWLQGACPPTLHGAKVGIGAVLAARRYAVIRSLTQEQVAVRLDESPPPDRQGQIRHIRATYGPAADQIITGYQPFLDMLEREFEPLRRSIRTHWPAIREIAASVPPAREIADLLGRAGGPGSPEELGLAAEDVKQALASSRYLRNRFTVNTVGRIVGVW